jgi:hypothetical protein
MRRPKICAARPAAGNGKAATEFLSFVASDRASEWQAYFEARAHAGDRNTSAANDYRSSLQHSPKPGASVRFRATTLWQVCWSMTCPVCVKMGEPFRKVSPTWILSRADAIPEETASAVMTSTNLAQAMLPFPLVAGCILRQFTIPNASNLWRRAATTNIIDANARQSRRSRWL